MTIILRLIAEAHSREFGLSNLLLKMYKNIFKIGFFFLAIIITIYNVRDRFFTKRVKLIVKENKKTSEVLTLFLDHRNLRDQKVNRNGVPGVFFTSS